MQTCESEHLSKNRHDYELSYHMSTDKILRNNIWLKMKQLEADHTGSKKHCSNNFTLMNTEMKNTFASWAWFVYTTDCDIASLARQGDILKISSIKFDRIS